MFIYQTTPNKLNNILIKIKNFYLKLNLMILLFIYQTSIKNYVIDYEILHFFIY